MKLKANKSKHGLFDILDDNKVKIGEATKYSCFKDLTITYKVDLLFNQSFNLKQKVYNEILQSDLKSFLKSLKTKSNQLKGKQCHQNLHLNPTLTSTGTH